MTQVYNQALQNMIDEMQDITPEINSIFIFQDDGTIVAKDKLTTDQSAQQFVTAYKEVEEKSQTIGGLKTLTLFGNYGELQINDVKNFHITTISSNKADKKTLELLTKVLAPTIIKFADQISVSALNIEVKPQQITEPQSKQIDNDSRYVDHDSLAQIHIDEEEARATLNIKLGPVQEKRIIDKLDLSNDAIGLENNLPTTHQLKVAKLKSLLTRTNSVRIDKELIIKWQENYDQKRIDEVQIESQKGTIATCKVDIIKDAPYIGRSMIQIPERVQTSLGVVAGEIVLIKPLIRDD